MNEAFPKPDQEVTKIFEEKLFEVKMQVQLRLIEERFGPQDESVKEIMSWSFVNGSKVDEIFRREPSLVEKFTTDPDTVFEKVKEELNK